MIASENYTSPAVMEAARAGLLQQIVVDEAHLVDQWGTDFRPEFQEIAGLRRDLLRVASDSPFRTLLATATLTESCLDTLETLFGQPGHYAEVSGRERSIHVAFMLGPPFSIFVKLDGPPDAVNAQKAAFESFARTLRMNR